MISVDLHKRALDHRMDSVDTLLRLTKDDGIAGELSKEGRGLAFVLMYAAYEDLLKSLTRTLLEAAPKCRVGFRRLRPGFQAFALKSTVQSVRASPEKSLFSTGLPKLSNHISLGPGEWNINPSDFPSDGSFFKRTQVQLWCELFDIGDLADRLPNIGHKIDMVVRERNKIAHGESTPDDVGREHSELEMEDLAQAWRSDWQGFIDFVGEKAKSRDFYRIP